MEKDTRKTIRKADNIHACFLKVLVFFEILVFCLFVSMVSGLLFGRFSLTHC